MNIPKSIKSNMVFAKNKNPKVQFNLQFSWIPQSNRSSFSKKFYLFYKKKKKKLFFLFYIITFTKHPYQSIYFIIFLYSSFNIILSYSTLPFLDSQKIK